MDDDTVLRSCLRAALSIGLFFVLGLVGICYSLLVAGGTLLPPRWANVAALPPASPVSTSGPKNVAISVAQSPGNGAPSRDGAVVPASPVPSAGSENTAASLAQSPGEGQTLFQEKCVSCHTIGGGTLVGPDLKGVTTRRDQAWLVRWLSAPDKMLIERDPIAMQLFKEANNIPMPNLALTETQVATLIAYLESPAGGISTAPPVEAATQALPEGDSDRGKALFTGLTRLQNGGPPCMACHSLAGLGALGGGALGPDLTPAYNKFGPEGLASILATTPFPTMNPIFGNRPLTPEEQANLWAFLQQAGVTERPAEAVGQLVLLTVGGTVILLALAHLLWRRRLTGVRRPLLRRAS